jgi:RNA methyltransferase, TrmH family
VFAAGAVDPFHPKSVRATAGSIFRLPVVRGLQLQDALTVMRDEGLDIVGADAGAPEAFDRVDLTRRLALVLGNEAWGLPAGAQELLDEKVGIPMPGPAESLNVGIAGSILLFECVRRRRLSSPHQ